MTSYLQIGETDAFFINENEADTRIDKILADRYKDVQSRTYFQFLIANNHVLINGKQIKKQHRPKTGDEVEVRFILTPELDLKAEKIPLDIIYEDQYIIVINKPVGMVVHPAPGNWTGTFVNGLLYHCQELKDNMSNNNVRPGIVHRLDKETSGVLIAAKDPIAHQRLVEMFAERKVYKEYLAVCLGNPGKGTINAPIGRHPVNRKLMAVIESGRPAVTHYESIAKDDKLSLVKLILETGRTHQIRVHLKYLKTPILGDASYGSTQSNEHYKVSRQLLHARLLRLKHPITGEELGFEAPVPDDMKVFLNRFNISGL